MKLYRIISVHAILLAGLFAAGCDANYNEYDNGVYLSEARENTSTKIVIDDKGGESSFSARVSKKTNIDVTVSFNIDPSALEEYNKRNGTAYQPLPADYFTFSANEAVIKAGQIGTEPIHVVVKPFDDKIDQNNKYAIPVVLESAEGGHLMNDTRHLILVIDQVIVTAVPYIANANMISYVYPEPKDYSQWTLEWLLNQDNFKRNNVTQWNIKDAKDGQQIIYTRFGDVTCPQDHFQAKIGNSKPQSAGALTAKKWYHLALVYDGQNLMLYINGELDMKTPHAKPGEIFKFGEVTFGNGKNSNYSVQGKISELRVWSVARSVGEIANNMYSVNPSTSGLEIYWKANEGEGKVLKDATPNQCDGQMTRVPTWIEGVRFPEGQ